MKNQFTISLFGPSAVGKGTIGKALVASNENIVRVPLDYYLRDKNAEVGIIFLTWLIDWKMSVI